MKRMPRGAAFPSISNFYFLKQTKMIRIDIVSKDCGPPSSGSKIRRRQWSGEWRTGKPNGGRIGASDFADLISRFGESFKNANDLRGNSSAFIGQIYFCPDW
jgi:hypothetical protein